MNCNEITRDGIAELIESSGQIIDESYTISWKSVNIFDLKLFTRGVRVQVYTWVLLPSGLRRLNIFSFFSHFFFLISKPCFPFRRASPGSANDIAEKNFHIHIYIYIFTYRSIPPIIIKTRSFPRHRNS